MNSTWSFKNGNTTWRTDLRLLGGGGGEWSGRDRELGVIGYNLEWIYKEILLSSTENYV